MVFNRSSATKTTVDLVLRDLLGMEELYRNLDILEHALQEKNERYHQLVDHLQTNDTLEHDSIVEDLQHQWEDLYQIQLQESMKEQARQNQLKLEAREKEWREQMDQMQRQSSATEKTALEKIQWLAEQLQQTKQSAHKVQLQTVQAARAKQEKLQSKLRVLQDKLDFHVQRAESEKVSQQDLWRQHRDLEVEMTAVKLQLFQSIQDLKHAVQVQQEQRSAEQQQHRDELSRREAQMMGQLEAARDQSTGEIAKLRLSLQGRQEEISRTLELTKEQFKARESWLEAQLRQVRDELRRNQHDSEAEFRAEKVSFDQREAALRAEIERKQDEIDQQIKHASLQSAEVQGLWRKRTELEKEIATLRHDYGKAVAEWEAKLASERESAHSDYRKREESLEQQLATAKVQIDAFKQNASSSKEALSLALEAKDLEHRSAFERLRQSLAGKIKDLSERLRQKGDELQESRAESQRILVGFRNASMAEQAKLLSKLRGKEETLQEQILLATAAAEKANEHWKRRMELESELSKMKHEYSEARKDWMKQLADLQGKSRIELQAASDLLSKRESEASELLRISKESFEANRTAWESRLRAQESQFRQLLQDFQCKSDQEKKKLLEGIRLMRDELHIYKAEVEGRLEGQKKAFQSKQAQLLSEISSREAELQKQRALTKSMAESSKSHWQTRTTLESELSSLKYEFNASMLEWETKLKSLAQERASEQKQMEEVVAQIIEKARSEVDSVRRVADERRRELEQNLAANITQQSLAFEKVLNSSKAEEVAMRRRIETLLNELKSYKLETQRQLATVKVAANSKQNDLMAQLSIAEKKLSDQVALTMAAEHRYRIEEDHRRKLESELVKLQTMLKEQVSSWESRFDELKASHDKALKEAEALLERKESEARARLQRVQQDAEAARASHLKSLREKDTEFSLSLQRLQEASQKSQEEARQQLAKADASYHELKRKSQADLEKEREGSSKTQEELLLKIHEKELELANQVNFTAQQRSKIEELRRMISDLHGELTKHKEKHKLDASALESRVKGIQEAYAKEQREASELLNRGKAEFKQKLLELTEDAQKQKLSLEHTLRDQASRHNQAIRDLTRVSRAKEEGLLQKIRALEALQKAIEKQGMEKLDSERLSATETSKKFEADMEDLRKQIHDLQDLLSSKETKVKELNASRATLESELASLQRRYDSEIHDLRKRCNNLMDVMDSEKRIAADRLKLVDSDAKQRIYMEIEAAQALRQSMRHEMEEKEARHRQELEELQEHYFLEAESLRERLNEVTSQLERLKTESDKPVIDVTHDDCKKLESLGQSYALSERRPPSTFTREAERVRYDLMKQLVRKNVELLRQQAEIKEKDSQIMALRSGRVEAEPLVRKRLNLAAIRERIAKLFRGDTDRRVAPSYSFQHGDAVQGPKVLVPETVFW
jgi:hypothetical protein